MVAAIDSLRKERALLIGAQHGFGWVQYIQQYMFTIISVVIASSRAAISTAQYNQDERSTRSKRRSRSQRSRQSVWLASDRNLDFRTHVD